jgi:hypothetical protein
MKTFSLIITRLKEFIQSGNYWRVVGFGLIVAFMGLLLGVAFLLIFEGLYSLSLRLTPFWQPAHKLFGKLSLANLENPNSLSGWKWVHIFLITTPPILLIIGGAYILSRTGFNNQNLIFLLLNK